MATRLEEIPGGRAGRIPPHNLGAEESVLGSMMLSRDAVGDVSEIVQADDFYRQAHQQIYQALLGLYGRGEPVDAITAVEELKRRGSLDGAGGQLYIHHLVESVPTPASAAHYAKIVAEHALLRRLIETSGTIAERAYEVPEDPVHFADQAEEMIYRVTRPRDHEQIVGLSALIRDSMEDLERLHERESAFTGLPTGFQDLDRLLQGLQPQNFIIVAARPGVGKSSFVTNLARNAAVAGKTVAMFSLEMSKREIGMRLLCSEARVAWEKIRSARVGAEDWSRIVEAAEVLDQAPLYIVDSGNSTIVDIRAKARRLHSREGLSLIIVDYLQLMSSAQRSENRQQEISDISRSLKLLAKELDVPVIGVSQLNREPEKRVDKRPQLADLRECVTGDTLVVLGDGRRVPIRDLVGSTPQVVSVSPEGRLVLAHSDKVWRVGRRKVFKVRLASGREIKATARHRFLGARGWVRVEDLQPGNRLALSRRLPEPLRTEEWPHDQVALLGQLVGDGSYLVHQPLRYTTASEANSSLVARAAGREFACAVRRYRGRGAWHQLLISGNGNRWHPAGVNRWLRELGIFGQRSHEKRLPESAFRLSNRQVGVLLRHLWATDGSIVVPSPSAKSAPRIYFSTSSRGLAEDVAALLLRFSIVARIRRTDVDGYRPCYSVDVSGTPDQKRFLKAVGAFGPRVRQAAQLRELISGTKPNTNVDTLPQETFDQVLRRMAELGISGRDMASLRGTAHAGSAHFQFAPSRTLLAEYAEILDDEDLRRQATSDLFWDRVVEISPAGEEEVFDLTVPGPSSWLADSIVSHNSGALEQDSDVVMFIHRDEMYSDDPALKGLAEVKVAKHRNGPIDTIKLTFISQLTQFQNYARPQ